MHLVCSSNNMCVMESPEGHDEDPCAGKFNGSYCDYAGTGTPSYPGGPTTGLTTTTGSGVAGAATFGGAGTGLVAGAGTTEEGVEEEKVEGAAAVKGESESKEAVKDVCCCVWWVFLLLQIILEVAYLVKIKGRNASYQRLGLIFLILGIGSYILYKLLCPWLNGVIGCLWPSLLLLRFCGWYWLFDIFAVVLGAIPYFVIRSGFLRSDKKDGESSPQPKPIQSFLNR